MLHRLLPAELLQHRCQGRGSCRRSGESQLVLWFVLRPGRPGPRCQQARRRFLLRRLRATLRASMDVSPLGSNEFVHAFAQHGRALWVLAAAWVGRSEAADLVQETARVAWQRRAAFATGTDLRAWLAQIARHIGANWRRRNRPEPRTHENLPEHDAPPGPTPVWPFDADRLGLSDELTRALGLVPEVARACLLLQVVMGLTFAEISTMLEIPENTAASHARRARLALREALQPQRVGRAPAQEMP